MANSSSGIPEVEIREGYLCPICVCDLKTVSQLQEHFESTHATEDHDVLQTLKGFIGKAKRKILKQDNYSEDANQSLDESSAVFNIPSNHSIFSPWSLQEIGITSSHSQYFKKFRDKRIDRYVMETNKLLIRLDKLICDISEDPEKRKEFEKKLVPWVPDSDVPLCPGCAKSFGLSRRRHHCRLCGGVMCNSCSHFISYEFARKLTLPMVSDDQQLLPKTTPVLRRPSSASVMSVVNFSAENQIRACKDCHVLLQRRDEMVQQKSHMPVIAQLYERLKDCMNEVEKLVPLYLEMIESLNAGETNYQLHDAQEIKLKISKLAERIDGISKRILNLEIDNEETNSAAAQLQSSIRMGASQFLRNMVIVLPSVPSSEDVAHYQRARQAQVQQRIQLEKQAEMLNSTKKESNKKFSPVTSPKKQVTEAISPETGWCISSDAINNDGDDPMLTQINNIRKYIEKAEKDSKYDEVKMLKNNLKELKLEYSKQQKNCS